VGGSYRLLRLFGIDILVHWSWLAIFVLLTWWLSQGFFNDEYEDWTTGQRWAAAAGFAPKPFADVTEADFDAAFGATAKGSFFVTQAAAPHLRSSRGVVVMIEDVAAYQPWPSFAAHCAAKAAQAMLTRVLARALAPEVRVCGIAAGPVAVESGQEERRAAETVLGRLGSPDDVAEAVLYLARAEFVTGTTLVVDGGRLLQTGPAGDA